MVMKTLSTHVSLLKIGQQSKGVVALASTKPCGALMISIQAVCYRLPVYYVITTVNIFLYGHFRFYVHSCVRNLVI